MFLLTVITLILVTAALRASYPVTMPIAVAAVIIAAVWPVKARLERVVGSGLAYVVAVAALVLVFAVFAAGLYLVLAQAARTLLGQQDRFRQLFEAASQWATQHGMPDPGNGVFDQATQLVQPLLAGAYTTLGYLGFIAVLVVLGLASVPILRRRVGAQLDHDDRHEFLDTVAEIAASIREYLWVTTLMSVLTGAATAACAFLFGLDLALSWGLLNFLLNYVPVVGNVIGVIPPALYGFVQFEGWGRPVALLAALTVIQIAISNFIYPLAQGKSLALPPVVIVVALTFWSWVWGIAGALIALPLTVAAIIACRSFASTRWIASLLTTRRAEGG